MVRSHSLFDGWELPCHNTPYGRFKEFVEKLGAPRHLFFRRSPGLPYDVPFPNTEYVNSLDGTGRISEIQPHVLVFLFVTFLGSARFACLNDCMSVVTPRNGTGLRTSAQERSHRWKCTTRRRFPFNMDMPSTPNKCLERCNTGRMHGTLISTVSTFWLAVTLY